MRRIQFVFLLLFLFISLVSFGQTAQTPKLNHVSLYIKDLAKSAEFYQNIVLLKKIPDPFNDGHHVWLSLGENLQLHLIQGPTQETVHEKRTHICLSTPSLE